MTFNANNNNNNNNNYYYYMNKLLYMADIKLQIVFLDELYSSENGKLNLAKYPTKHFVCTANTPHQGTIHWMKPVCYDSVVDEP